MAALRSPLYPLLGDTMLISLTGRKSGREICLPVNYFRDGQTLWVLSSRKRTWWRNLCSPAEVRLHIRGRDVAGLGEAILDETAVAAQLAEFTRRFPGSARNLGLQMQNGVPNAEDILRVSQERLFVKICVL